MRSEKGCSLNSNSLIQKTHVKGLKKFNMKNQNSSKNNNLKSYNFRWKLIS